MAPAARARPRTIACLPRSGGDPGWRARTPGPSPPSRPLRSAAGRHVTASRGNLRPVRDRPQRPACLGLGEVVEVDLGSALAPKPAARSKHRTAELGGRTKHVGPAESLVIWPLAQAIRNLAKGSAGDRRGAVDVIDETGHVVQNQGEVRIELAFYRRRPCAEDWRFDVYLIHYWDGERMRAV